jgi:phosphocarrier protein HPr
MIHAADVVIVSRTGLHARPAASLSRLAASLGSTVTLKTADKSVNARSVLAIITAAIKEGDTVTVQCEGESAEGDLDTIVNAITSGLGD